MSYRSATQPLCRLCGKPIRKLTTTVSVNHDQPTVDRLNARSPNYYRYVLGPLRTRADCQATTNERVVSVRRHHASPESIGTFYTWDGESYIDPFFCNGTCASEFAYVMARSGRCTIAYNEAISRRAAA